MRWVVPFIIYLAFTLLSGAAYAQDAPITTSTTSSNVESQIQFVSALFDLARVFGMVAGLILMLWLSMNFFASVTEHENHGRLQQMEYKPVSIFRFFIGMALGMVLFFQPFTMMSLIGDVFNKGDSTVCLVLEINDPWSSIVGKGGADCLADIKTDIAGSVDVEALDDNSLTLFFGALQLVSFVFLLIGAGYFMMNMLGAKNMKITTGRSLIIIIASSALMVSPSFISMANDLRGESSAPQVTSGG